MDLQESLVMLFITTVTVDIVNVEEEAVLRTYVSATGIKRTVYKLIADHYGPSDLRGVSFDELSTTMITESAKNGDQIALEAFEYTGKILGSKLAETVHHTNPEAVFYSWGFVKSRGLYLQTY